MIFITGDTHSNFERVTQLCRRFKPTIDDTIIILGDAGINYYGEERDCKLKKALSQLPITIFSIHGNHEIRPETISTYKEFIWNDGIVYREDKYPNLLFAKEGEVYDIDGLKTLVIGGAYSVDKQYRIDHSMGWWADEQPSDEIKAKVEKTLADRGNKIDVILSHTTPLKYVPTEVFLSFIDQSDVDNSTEEWLDKIENTTAYKKWYCGHYHTNKKIDKMIFLFKDIIEFKP